MKPSLASPVFLDTNVLVCLLDADTEKACRAEALLREGGWVSVQVLNELVSVLRKKLCLDWPDIETVLAAVQAHCEVVNLDLLMHQEAVLLARLHQLAWYDAVIVAAAQRCGARTLWSQDMQHERAFEDGLRIRNPFAD